MCDATTIAAVISVGTAVAGSVAQHQGMAQADRAQANVIRNSSEQESAAAMARREMAAKGFDSVEQTLATMKPADVESVTGANAANRALRYEDVARNEETRYAPGQAGGDGAVRDAVAREQIVADRAVGQQAKALAGMTGWDEALFGIRRNVTRSAEQLAQNANFVNGMQGIAGLQRNAHDAALRSAGFAGSGLRATGDLLNAAGTFAGPIAKGAKSAWSDIFASGPSKTGTAKIDMSGIGGTKV